MSRPTESKFDTSVEAIDFVVSYPLMDSKLGDSSMAQDFYVSVLQTAEDRYMMHTKSEMKTLAKDMNATEDEKKEDAQATALPPLKLSPCSIIAFDDKYEKDELVYSIQVNHVRQLIMVCFRGTVTKTDWATDFEIYMKAVPNPIKHHQTQKPTIKIHNGFYDYLFEKTERGAKGPNGEPLSEYEEILQEHVMPVLKQFPGYKVSELLRRGVNPPALRSSSRISPLQLYVTGHSLGGALATLFAFEAAAAPDSEIPKPVSLFSIASPYVGDESFRAAHQILESQGKLRHLRLSNHKDVVTIVPKMSWRWRFYDSSSSVGSLFKHVGMNIRLFEGDYAPEINYPAVRTGVWTSTYEEMSRGWEQTLFWNFSWNPLDYYLWPWHGVSAYSHRLRANAPSLKSMSLNELYSRKDIVGNLVPQF